MKFCKLTSVPFGTICPIKKRPLWDIGGVMSNLFAGILIGAGAILPGISSRSFFVLFWFV